jgi:hypothetical protein
MAGFTKDKWLSFVIDRYDEIAAIEEIYGMAKKRLPEMVDRAVADCIFDLRKDFFEKEGLLCREDEGEVIWYDPHYFDDDKDIGIYFSYEHSVNYRAFRSLIPESGDFDPAWLSVKFIPNGKNKAARTKEFEAWAAYLKLQQPVLAKKQINFEPDEEETILLAYYFQNELDIRILNTPEEFESRVEKSVKDFTTTILPIIRKKK